MPTKSKPIHMQQESKAFNASDMLARMAGARQRELVTLDMVKHPRKAAVALRERRYDIVADLVEYIQHDVPRSLAQTDIALFRTLRRGVSELMVMGFGKLNASDLRNLATR